MPVTRPAYGRKPHPSVTPPDTRSKTAKAELAKKAARDAAVHAAIASTITIIS